MFPFQFNKNSVVLIGVSVIVLGFFVCGLFDILNFFMVKFIFITALIGLGVYAVWILVKKHAAKTKEAVSFQETTSKI